MLLRKAMRTLVRCMEDDVIGSSRGGVVRVGCAQLPARGVDDALLALHDIERAIGRAATRHADLLVLPECSYPGYVLMRSDPYSAHIPSAAQALRRIGRAARRAGVCVAIGIARADSSGRLRNEAVFLDRRGQERAHYAKIHLWNFDRRWFRAGDAVEPFDTEFGRLGMMICADGRVPEIARRLSAGGAWLILDPTAWVSCGENYGAMPNPQVEFMLSVRARENAVWIAAADKCGSEMSAVHYVGRSMVVDPSGRTCAMASADRPELIVVEAARRKTRAISCPLSIGERARLARRRPAGAHERPHRARLSAAEGLTCRIGIYQPASRRVADWSQARRVLTAQGAAATLNAGAGQAQIMRALRTLKGLRFSALVGQEMLAPEPARAAALGGADAVVWVAPPAKCDVRAFARTRAVENRIFVIVCATARDLKPACVIGPDGSVLAAALAKAPSGFVAAIDPGAARDKVVTWGTDVMADRGMRFALR